MAQFFADKNDSHTGASAETVYTLTDEVDNDSIHWRRDVYISTFEKLGFIRNSFSDHVAELKASAGASNWRSSKRADSIFAGKQIAAKTENAAGSVSFMEKLLAASTAWLADIKDSVKAIGELSSSDESGLDGVLVQEIVTSRVREYENSIKQAEGILYQGPTTRSQTRSPLSSISVPSFGRTDLLNLLNQLPDFPGRPSTVHPSLWMHNHLGSRYVTTDISSPSSYSRESYFLSRPYILLPFIIRPWTDAIFTSNDLSWSNSSKNIETRSSIIARARPLTDVNLLYFATGTGLLRASIFLLSKSLRCKYSSDLDLLLALTPSNYFCNLQHGGHEFQCDNCDDYKMARLSLGISPGDGVTHPVVSPRRRSTRRSTRKNYVQTEGETYPVFIIHNEPKPRTVKKGGLESRAVSYMDRHLGYGPRGMTAKKHARIVLESLVDNSKSRRQFLSRVVIDLVEADKLRLATDATSALDVTLEDLACCTTTLSDRLLQIGLHCMLGTPMQDRPDISMVPSAMWNQWVVSSKAGVPEDDAGLAQRIAWYFYPFRVGEATGVREHHKANGNNQNYRPRRTVVIYHNSHESHVLVVCSILDGICDVFLYGSGMQRQGIKNTLVEVKACISHFLTVVFSKSVGKHAWWNKDKSESDAFPFRIHQHLDDPNDFQDPEVPCFDVAKFQILDIATRIVEDSLGDLFRFGRFSRRPTSAGYTLPSTSEIDIQKLRLDLQDNLIIQARLRRGPVIRESAQDDNEDLSLDQEENLGSSSMSEELVEEWEPYCGQDVDEIVETETPILVPEIASSAAGDQSDIFPGLSLLSDGIPDYPDEEIERRFLAASIGIVQRSQVMLTDDDLHSLLEAAGPDPGPLVVSG